MPKSFVNAIKHIIELPDDEECKLMLLIKERSVKKGDSFIREGVVPDYLGFVKKGLFRYYYRSENGAEFTKGFYAENSFLSAYSAMVLRRPSYFAIEALEDSEIVLMSYSNWRTLFEEHACWKDFLIFILEKAFIKKETREREFLLYDAETRYRSFLQTYPGLEGRIKQHLIASYLGITPVALSRIRRKMNLLT